MWIMINFLGYSLHNFYTIFDFIMAWIIIRTCKNNNTIFNFFKALIISLNSLLYLLKLQDEM